MDILNWLLDPDPAIHWQVLRDLADASPAAIAAERARVPHEGVGAEILALQGPDGAWHRPDAPDWLPTLFIMIFLRATGADRADPAVDSAVTRLEAGFRWDEAFGSKPFFEGEVEPCINGGTLALGAYFGRPAEKLAQRLIGEQLNDGGWNCEAPKSTRASFHTTICVLEGLLEYERAVGPAQQKDGRWVLDRAHDEALAFQFAESVGEPSRWNTPRALRVLRWNESARRITVQQ